MANKLHIIRSVFESIEDAQHAVGGADLRSVQLKAGTPKGSMLYASTGEVIFSTGKIQADIRTRGILDPHRVTLGMNLNPNPTIFSMRSGKKALPGDLYAFAPGSEFDNRSQGQAHYATLSLSEETLVKLCANDALIRGTDVGFWEHRMWFRASPQVRAAVCRSITHIASQLIDPVSAMSEQQAMFLQHELAELFLRGIVFDEGQSSEKAYYSSAQIVRKVEDWIEMRWQEPFHLSDICRALHVSRRTLHRAFNETLGMGPVHYIKLKRLSTVRSILRHADPATTIVSSVAMDYGFWELGRFAVEYRRMFGEKPSETLQKHR